MGMTEHGHQYWNHYSALSIELAFFDTPRHYVPPLKVNCGAR